MGYSAIQIDGSLDISKNITEAMRAGVMGHRGIAPHDFKGQREVGELSEEDLRREFEEAAQDCGFNVDIYDEHISLVWEGDKIGSWMEDLLDSLAKYFDEGSRIIFSGEDGAVWMEDFRDGKRVQDDCSMLPQDQIIQARRNVKAQQDQLKRMILAARSVVELSEPNSVARGLAQQQVGDLEDILALAVGIEQSLQEN